MKAIKLTHNQTTLIDDEDFDRVSSLAWHAVYDKRGKQWRVKHAFRQNGKVESIFLHRWLLNAPPHLQVDHQDRNPLNNQKNNLRLATPAQNQQNSTAQSNNRLGVKGVIFVKAKHLYKASVSCNKKRYNLGYFHTLLDATKAYNEKAQELHGEFACINNIDASSVEKINQTDEAIRLRYPSKASPKWKKQLPKVLKGFKVIK